MNTVESVGKYIATYYWNVASPNFGMPPDTQVTSDAIGVTIAHHDLDEARLTTIRRPMGIENHYIRFLGLAASIPKRRTIHTRVSTLLLRLGRFSCRLSGYCRIRCWISNCTQRIDSYCSQAIIIQLGNSAGGISRV